MANDADNGDNNNENTGNDNLRQTALHMQTGPAKYAFKYIPTFNPNYFRRWASNVHDAFAERNWLEYLQYPPPNEEQFKPNNGTLIQAKILISKSIPDEHSASLDDYSTAAEIFQAFKQQYGSSSR